MNLFINKSLQVKTRYLLGSLLLVALLQYLFIRHKINAVERYHARTDYARSAQLTFQQLSLLAHQIMNGREDHASQALALIEEHEHQLVTLADGGRIDNSPVLISKLSELTSITYDVLYGHWSNYKKNILQLVDNPQTPSPKTKAIIEGLWLNVSQWHEKFLADLSAEQLARKKSAETTIAIFTGIDLAAFGLIFFLFHRHLLSPLRKIEANTAKHMHTVGLPANEVGKVAMQVNEVIEQLKDATDFVETIGKGDLSLDYRSLDNRYTAGKNLLADSLIKMQSQLKTLQEEDNKRKWANEGLAKFVDILRSTGEDINKIGDRIISALVEYTDSNQGGLYLVNDDDANNRYLELVSLFAFNTKRFETQKIKPGEGILGQTFLENETTYLTNVPEEYIRITSGLGGANPKSVLIVPLKIDQDVYGLVELASFNEYQPHEITFVEKLGETIASTLSSVKAAQRNRKLLEESRIATEAMRAQEEEMRQNMEELQATQEEMARKERDYISRIKELEERNASGKEAELEAVKKQLATSVEKYEQQIQTLESQLKLASSEEAKWADVEELEKMFKINLEAMKITREELNGNPGSANP